MKRQHAIILFVGFAFLCAYWFGFGIFSMMGLLLLILNIAVSEQ